MLSKSLPCLLVSVSLLVPLLSGCASESRPAQQADANVSHAQHAECLVCKHNADLACVYIAVKDKTPVTMYNGKAYYFCSDECKNEFLKHPEKYAQQK